MRVRFSPGFFLVAYCFTYVVVLALDAPLFRYYPLHGLFCWGWERLSNQGPGMAWYGLEAYATIAGLVAAVLVSDKLMGRVREHLWIVPFAGMSATLFLLRSLFLQ